MLRGLGGLGVFGVQDPPWILLPLEKGPLSGLIPVLIAFLLGFWPLSGLIVAKTANLGPDPLPRPPT